MSRAASKSRTQSFFEDFAAHCLKAPALEDLTSGSALLKEMFAIGVSGRWELFGLSLCGITGGIPLTSGLYGIDVSGKQPGSPASDRGASVG